MSLQKKTKPTLFLFLFFGLRFRFMFKVEELMVGLWAKGGGIKKRFKV